MMKRIGALITLSMVISFALHAQQYPPAPVAAFKFAAGVWAAATTSGTSNPAGYPPTPVGLYCYNNSTQQWVVADSSCFGGGASMTWPATAGIAVCTGTPCTAWVTSYSGTNPIPNTYLPLTLQNLTLATTQTQGDNSTKLATTAYVDTGLAGKQASGSYVLQSTTVNGHALSSNVTVAPADLAAGALANGMTATTQAAQDNSTKLATTAYVDAATSTAVSFTLNTGVAASPAVPYQTAPKARTVTACYYTTTTSDAATDLVINIKKSAGSGAGTSILNSGSATISHTSTAKQQTSLTLTGTINVSALDEWELDVTGGTSSITGSIVCY